MTLELVDRIPRRPGPQQARLEPLPEGGCGAPSTSAPAPQHAATQNAPLGLGSGDTISRLLVAGQIDEVLASIALGRRQLLSGDISPLYLDRTAATVLGELGASGGRCTGAVRGSRVAVLGRVGWRLVDTTPWVEASVAPRERYGSR